MVKAKYIQVDRSSACVIPNQQSPCRSNKQEVGDAFLLRWGYKCSCSSVLFLHMLLLKRGVKPVTYAYWPVRLIVFVQEIIHLYVIERL